MALNEDDIVHADQVWAELPTEKRARAVYLLRGVPHSAHAREEWNEMAFGLGVHPNALLSAARSAGS